MSNIFATRRGFLYQDRFAVLQFLKYFQSKEIVEFYIDYTFDQSCRRSVDVIIVLTNGIKFIFEVKSGQDFKHDKRKKDSSEVRDAFNQFLEYTATKGPSNMSFVMTPELRGKVTQYWRYLTELQDTPSFRSPNARHPVKWLFQKLNINYFTSHKMLYDFVKNLTITCGDSDIPDNTNDQHSPIDDLVSQKIRDLSFDFRANTTEPELPCEMLYHQMLFLCQKYAGTNRNICELLTDLILKFFSQRQMINRTASGDFHNIFEGTKRFYTTWRTQLSAVTSITPEVSVAIVSEGGVIHE